MPGSGRPHETTFFTAPHVARVASPSARRSGSTLSTAIMRRRGVMVTARVASAIPYPAERTSGRSPTLGPPVVRSSTTSGWIISAVSTPMPRVERSSSSGRRSAARMATAHAEGGPDVIVPRTSLMVRNHRRGFPAKRRVGIRWFSHCNRSGVTRCRNSPLSWNSGSHDTNRSSSCTVP